MNYKKEYAYVPVYKYVSNNQHGKRYMKAGVKKLQICKITATEPSEYQQLIIMGSTLDVPVRFDFGLQRPYLELVSGEEVKTLK